MEYRPSCPAKNFSHNGRSSRSPLARNKKATLGARWYGVLRTLGVMDAHHSSSSSVMLCMALGGSRKRASPTCGFCGGSGAGGGEDGTGGGDNGTGGGDGEGDGATEER